jgi:2-keto-4-pentenoate hydratase/2-oxohepta-3-ene-1,7-dioic acid hydratase in catechol pathway
MPYQLLSYQAGRAARAAVLFLKPGDRVKLWIESVGELSHTMVG